MKLIDFNAQSKNKRMAILSSLPAQQHFGTSPGTEETVPFHHYLWLLRVHWRKIVLSTVGSALITYVVTSRLTPIYESTARIAINLNTPSTLVGTSSITSSGGSETDQFFNTEIQLIQSDSVLRPVANQFRINTASHKSKLLQNGQELDAPIYLSNLSVTHPTSSFLINISYRSADPISAASIANAVAHTYIFRQMQMRVQSSMEESTFIEKQISELKKNMDSSSSALNGYEKQLGMVNPNERTSILAARLMQLNTEYTDSQHDRIKKETEYKALKSGSLAALQISSYAASLGKMEDQIREVQQKLETIKTIYGLNNIEVKRITNELAELTRQYETIQLQVGKRIDLEYQESLTREQMLHSSLLEAKRESDALNARSTEYQDLKREAETNRALYGELFRKVKEAGINGAFQGSAIRIADEARPSLSPVFPNKSAFVAIGGLFTTSACCLAILFTDLFDKTLKDPLQAQRALGLDVLGILPYVADFNYLSPLTGHDSRDNTSLRTSARKWFERTGFYEDAIDTLLSSIFLMQNNLSLRSILVTSAMPGEGKSSCIAHMAAAYARQGYRTLLIDADLRCPSQHHIFRLNRQIGLANVILQGKNLRDVTQTVDQNENLHVITSGNVPKRIYDHVSRAVDLLLNQGRLDYDLILIDAPPMLCFAEPIQLASLADGVLIVNRAGETNLSAVSTLLTTLRRVHANTLGLVLNQVRYDMSMSYESYQPYYEDRSDITLNVI